MSDLQGLANVWASLSYCSYHATKIKLSEIHNSCLRIKWWTLESNKCLTRRSPVERLSWWMWIQLVLLTNLSRTDAWVPCVEGRHSTGSWWRPLVSMAVTSCYVRKLRIHSPGCHGSGNPAPAALSWATVFSGFKSNEMSSGAVG